MTLEEALQIVLKRTLPPGYKPEDYFFVGDGVPLRIATMIVKDALHLMKMSHGSKD